MKWVTTLAFEHVLGSWDLEETVDTKGLYAQIWAELEYRMTWERQARADRMDWEAYGPVQRHVDRSPAIGATRFRLWCDVFAVECLRVSAHAIASHTIGQPVQINGQDRASRGIARPPTCDTAYPARVCTCGRFVMQWDDALR